MTIALAAEEIECFRSLVVRCVGLYFEDAKLDMLAGVLRQRMESTGCDLFLAYRQRLTSAASGCQEIGSRGAADGMRSVLFRIAATAASVRRSYDPPARSSARASAQAAHPLRRTHVRRGGLAYSLSMLIRHHHPSKII